MSWRRSGLHPSTYQLTGRKQLSLRHTRDHTLIVFWFLHVNGFIWVPLHWPSNSPGQQMSFGETANSGTTEKSVSWAPHSDSCQESMPIFRHCVSRLMFQPGFQSLNVIRFLLNTSACYRPPLRWLTPLKPALGSSILAAPCLFHAPSPMVRHWL